MARYTITLEPDKPRKQGGRGIAVACMLGIIIPVLVGFVLILVSKGDFLDFLLTTKYGHFFLIYLLALLLIAAVTTSNNQKKGVTHHFKFDEETIRGDFVPFYQPIHWSEVDSIVLRDKVLTINLKHKGVLQFNMLPPDFPPAAFDLFCAKRIAAYRF